MDLFVSHSWKGTIFSPTWIPPSTSRCWRSFGRPSSPPTSPCTSITTSSWRSSRTQEGWTWTTTCTGQATNHGTTEKKRPTGAHKCAFLSFFIFFFFCMDITRLCSPPGTVWLVWWWQHVTCVLLPSGGKSHDSQLTTSMLSSGLRYSGILFELQKFQCHDHASSFNSQSSILACK